MEANTKPPAQSAKVQSSPEPTQRPEARCRVAPLTKTRAERCRAGASLGGEHSNPLAQSAKDHPPQSLLSERRPDAADNVAERCRAGASLGGEHPTPSRKARKLLLPRAYSASAGLIPRSLLSERRPDAAEPIPVPSPLGHPIKGSIEVGELAVQLRGIGLLQNGSQLPATRPPLGQQMPPL